MSLVALSSIRRGTLGPRKMVPENPVLTACCGPGDVERRRRAGAAQPKSLLFDETKGERSRLYL